jgi:hypothetical protein
MTPAAPVVVTTPAELEALVLRAVAAALGERSAPAPDTDSRLLSRSGLAAALGVSPATVSRWRVEGLPCIALGTTPRFRLAAVRAWLDSRQTAGSPARDSTPHPAPVVELGGCRRVGGRRAGGGGAP